MGLRHLAEAMRLRFQTAQPGDVVPELLNRQVQVWKKGSGDPDKEIEQVLWLDLRHLIYCDGFRYGDGNCTKQFAVQNYWVAKRPKLQDINELMKDSPHRQEDMARMLVGDVPDLDDEDLSIDELDERAQAVAVIVDRGRRQK